MHAALLDLYWYCTLQIRTEYLLLLFGIRNDIRLIKLRNKTSYYEHQLVIARSRVCISAAVLQIASQGKLFTHVPLSPSSIIW